MAYAPTSRRTVANAVIVEGFFAFMWFSWGQAGPPAWESLALAIGAVLAVLVVVAVAVAAAVVGVSTDVLPSSVTGLGAGACLLVHAGALAARGRQMRQLDGPAAARCANSAYGPSTRSR